MNDNTAKLHRLLGMPGNLSGDDLRYGLSLVGSSVTDIARTCGCTASAVSQVLDSREKSISIATAVAAALGTTVPRLWGDDAYAYVPRGRRPMDAPPRRRRAAA